MVGAVMDEGLEIVGGKALGAAPRGLVVAGGVRPVVGVEGIAGGRVSTHRHFGQRRDVEIRNGDAAELDQPLGRNDLLDRSDDRARRLGEQTIEDRRSLDAQSCPADRRIAHAGWRRRA